MPLVLVAASADAAVDPNTGALLDDVRGFVGGAPQVGWRPEADPLIDGVRVGVEVVGRITSHPAGLRSQTLDVVPAEGRLDTFEMWQRLDGLLDALACDRAGARLLADQAEHTGVADRVVECEYIGTGTCRIAGRPLVVGRFG